MQARADGRLSTHTAVPRRTHTHQQMKIYALFTFAVIFVIVILSMFLCGGVDLSGCQSDDEADDRRLTALFTQLRR